jgi:hypothetical protein
MSGNERLNQSDYQMLIAIAFLEHYMGMFYNQEGQVSRYCVSCETLSSFTLGQLPGRLSASEKVQGRRSLFDDL